MKIAALIKQVPDTETRIRIKGDGSGIEEEGIKYVISPYDEFAVEEAIRTREKAGAGETCVISLGPERVVEAIRTALAMGIDKGIAVNSEGVEWDSFLTAKALAAVIKKEGYDLIFCGKQAIDDDAGAVASMAAEFLGIPQVLVVDKFELNADKKSALVTRRVAGGAKEIYEAALPAVVGCDRGLNTPRYASLPGIMKAKSKPVEKLKGSDLLEGVKAMTRTVNFQLPAERASGKKIEGEPPQQAATLVRLLREEAKII